MRRNQRLFRILSLIATGVVAVILVRVNTRVKASFMIVEKKDALETVLANGRIAGRRVVSLAFTKSGQVSRISVREGALVTRGDTLCALDDGFERVAIAQRRSAVSIARLNLQRLGSTGAAQAEESYRQALTNEEAAKKQLDRMSTLYASNAVPKSELENAQQSLDLAVSRRKVAESTLSAVGGADTHLLQSQIEQAQSFVTQAEIDLSRCFLRAPEDGKVLELKVSAGEILTPGAVVCTFLPSDTTTHAELQVDENEVLNLKIGQRALISLIALPGKTFDAAVRDILPVIDASRGTATIQLEIATDGQEFLPDQTVSAQIITGTRSGVLVVEQRFLLLSGNKQKVFRLNDRRARETEVSAGDLGDGTYIIEKGISEGDTLLLAPKLTDGVKVAVQM